MLSTSVIRNVAQASHYFTGSENYYTREVGFEQSEWGGLGAQKLGLAGVVGDQQFTDLLNGLLPDGQTLGKIEDGKRHHRPGWDLTFSAPKSVSILAIIMRDMRIVDAHRKAVKIALSEIEKDCAEIRIKLGGKLSYVSSKNLIAALYHHDLSFAEDPQLHTHCIVMNATQRQDGAWRSMASKMGRYDKESKADIHGFIERARHNKRYYGKIYEAELAFAVKQLGYEIEVAPDKVFEIKGVPHQVIEHFSKRRHVIQDVLKGLGLNSGRAAEMATLSTRDKKAHTPRELLSNLWQEAIQSLGFEGQALVEKSYAKPNTKTKLTSPEMDLVADNILKKAAQELSQFKNSFALDEILTEATSLSLGNRIQTDRIIASVKRAIQTGELIKIENEQSKTILMTKSILEFEQKIANLLTNQIPLVGVWRKSHNCTATDLASEESRAIKDIFSDKRYVMVEGTWSREILAKPIMEIAKNHKLELRVVAPNQITSRAMAREFKELDSSLWNYIKSLFQDPTLRHENVVSFLKERNSGNPDLVLVDNFHLLSTKSQAEILEWGAERNTKLILFSEKHTLLSQKPDSGFNYLNQHGMKVVTINPPENSVHAAVENRDIQASLRKIQSNLVEEPVLDSRLKIMARQFAALTDTKNSFLVSNKNSSVESLNLFTHQEIFASRKQITRQEVRILKPIYLSENKAEVLKSYPLGHVIRVNIDHKAQKIKRGEYLQVIGHIAQSNQLLVKNSRGKSICLSPAKGIELFKEIRQEWCVGERIVCSRAIGYLQLVRGELLTIQSITDNKVSFKRDTGRSVRVDLSKDFNRHFDYGYAVTLHNIAHEKARRIIIDMPRQSVQANQRQLFQCLSHAENVSVYTDNIKALCTKLGKCTGDRLNAHEILQNSAACKSNLQSFYQILQEHLKLDSAGFISNKAIDAVDFAIKHLSEREAGFTHQDLMLNSMMHALGDVNPQEFDKAVLAMEKAGVLLKAHNDNSILWTTQEALKMEQAILTLCEQDRGKFQALATEEAISRHCDPQQLDAEQISAIRSIALSQDRIVSIQGRAGTGKTTMLVTLQAIVTANDEYKLMGVAPTHRAVKELNDRGIPADTIDSYLMMLNRSISNSDISAELQKTILIIDEASMVSNRKMLSLLEATKTCNFRQVVAIGDVRQLAAIESGKPHEIMQSVITPLTLENIKRQQNPILKKSVQEVYKHQYKEAFFTLSECIAEIVLKTNNDKDFEARASESRQTRLDTLVDAYVSLSHVERDKTQIITPGHDDREIVNAKIREVFQKTGELASTQYSFPVLCNEDLTLVEKSHAANLKADQIIKFHVSSGRDIRAGDYLTIKEVHSKHNILVLARDSGEEVTWQIPRSRKSLNNSIEVFRREVRSISIGDKIVWVRSDKKNGLVSTEFAKVIAVQDENVTAEKFNKEIIKFNGQDRKYQHWDHGYAVTAYGAQGGTYDNIIAHLEGYRSRLSTQRAFLVIITRAVHNLKIFTDDKRALLDCIEQNRGDKLSSLELLSRNRRHSVASVNTKEDKTKLGHKHSLEIKEPRFDRSTIELIKEGLNQRAEQVAIDLLGQPKLRGANYLKFGSKQGSLAVTTRGERQGWWNDFAETNRGGRSILTFLEKIGNMSRQDALKHGAYVLGIATTPASNTKNRTQRMQQTVSKEEVDSEYQKKMCLKAIKIAEECRPIKGTIAEKYLTEHRGISIENISEDVRFHPGIYSSINQKKLPALVGIVRNSDDKITAVEAIFLDPKTANKAPDLKVGKQTFGTKKGGDVLLNVGDPKGPTIVTEGIVTGLSVANALPNVRVICVLGKKLFSHINPESITQKVILSLDFDGKKLSLDPTIRQAAERLQAMSKEVSFMVPHGLNLEKFDYNDVLKLQGLDPLNIDYLKAVSYGQFYSVNPPNTIKEPNAMENIVIDKIRNKTNQDTLKTATRDVDQYLDNFIVNNETKVEQNHSKTVAIEGSSVAPKGSSKQINVELEL